MPVFQSPAWIPDHACSTARDQHFTLCFQPVAALQLFQPGRKAEIEIGANRAFRKNRIDSRHGYTLWPASITVRCQGTAQLTRKIVEAIRCLDQRARWETRLTACGNPSARLDPDRI